MEQLSETIRLRGCLMAVLHNAQTGEIIETRKVDNLLVTVGRVWVLKHLESVNANTQVLSHFAIGSVTTTPVTGDSALGGEVTRKAISSFDTSGETANPPFFQAQVSFATNEGNTTLAEAGLFQSSAGGIMLNHATFTSFVKATSNTLGLSFNISA